MVSLLFLSTKAFLWTDLKDTESLFFKSITSCLVIKDYATAIDMSKTAVTAFPNSSQMKRLLIRSLAEGGESLEALHLFQKESSSLKEDFFLLEALSWSFLSQKKEYSEVATISSLIGASLTQDSRSVDLISKALDSSNVFFRSFAVQLAGQKNDRVLQKQLLNLLKEEKNWYVRLELIRSIGQMRLSESIPFLKDLVSNRSASSEEKSAAIYALICMDDNISDLEVDALLQDRRSWMREYGIAVIDHLFKEDKIETALPLLKDPSPRVRSRLLAFLGTLDLKKALCTQIETYLPLLLEDSHPKVATLAAWLQLKIDGQNGEELLLKKVLCEDVVLSRFAASVVCASGRFMTHTLKQLFNQVTDSYVKANLAIGMLKQKVEIPFAIDYLKKFFLENREKIMWKEEIYPMFTTLCPSRISHLVHVPQYPDLIDQSTRLDLLSILYLFGCEEATTLGKSLLKQQPWGIVTGASALLLQEGDEKAIDLITSLLKDTDKSIQLQAALALAFYGADPSMAKVLEKTYSQVNWEKRVQILRALGHIGNRESIPFFLEVMKEPFWLLKILSATGIIQCLYH